MLYSLQGEGFSSFPALYDHPLTYEEEMLLEDDVSRTSDCCLFFLKKGFPFVSILRGGFAAAHAFLWRSGPDMGLPPSNVLVDYDPLSSLFAQLETARQEQEEYKNAPAREKTAKTLQKIIDRSMTRLTIEEHRLNSLASDFSRPENVDKMKQSVRSFSQKVSTTSISFGKTPPLFMTKKFASKPAESIDPESTQAETSKMPSIASFKEKMALKLSVTKEVDESAQDVNVHTTETNSQEQENTKDESKPEIGNEEVSDSLRALDAEPSAKQDQEPFEAAADENQFPSMSKFRLKMGFSSIKAVQDSSTDADVKPNDTQGDTLELSQLKMPFGFLKKQGAQTTQSKDEITEQNAIFAEVATDGTSQFKKHFGFLKKQTAAASQSTDDNADMDASTPSTETREGSNQIKNTFGFLKKQSASAGENPIGSTASDSVAAEAVKSKLASLSKFGSSLLHKKEAQDGTDQPDMTDSESLDQPKQTQPSSPVKATFDNVSKSFEAVKSGANKLLNEISEYEDPFNPKNSRPVKTRFSGAQPKTVKKPSLVFMEDDHDDGLEDIIDFGAGTESETAEELSDPFESLVQASATKSEDLFSGLSATPAGDSTQNLSGDFSFEEKEAGDKATDDP